ncbi:hypothetical protein OPV22_018673 [Ensete ventricosum]|uniref:TF-B3 domain-containing protein n=1 Tax=Ensete ventricosum TaxID=4639 RepID=A0AAV8QZ60_ENSVE|nr:hypothetical protein OPV22_018673 [Ensete ventricosum]
MPGCDQSVPLRLPGGGKTWEVNYIVHYKATKLGSGWRNFVVDNYLEKDDVCVFEIISAEKNHDFVLEVNIFRAVSPVIVPPAELSTEGLGGETK